MSLTSFFSSSLLSRSLSLTEDLIQCNKTSESVNKCFQQKKAVTFSRDDRSSVQSRMFLSGTQKLADDCAVPDLEMILEMFHRFNCEKL